MQTKTDIIGMLNLAVSNQKGYMLSADGSMKEYKFDGKTYDIQKIKDLCNFDYIEIVYLPNDLIMIVDEEGLLKSKPYNFVASVIYQAAYDDKSLGIVGDAILCHSSRVNQSIITLGLHYFQKTSGIFLEVFLKARYIPCLTQIAKNI